MKKTLLALSVATAALLASCTSVPSANNAGYKLEKVVIFSRHGIRTPLAGSDGELAEITPHTWPAWNSEGSQLTGKGAQLEQIFGKYWDGWFAANGLVAADACPGEDILIYANSRQRTVATGQALVDGAFPGCDVKVHQLVETGKTDANFSPLVRHETDEAFTTQALASADAYLGKGGLAALNSELAANYAALEEVLDYGRSAQCKEQKSCDFGQTENRLTYTQGKQPKLTGALRTATSAGDSFILQYYEGFADKDVAWGKITTEDQWRKILAAKNLYNDLLFGTPFIAKEVATPLLTFIQNSFENQGLEHPLIASARQAKIVYLVGHDSNIGSLLPLLQAQPYDLPGQYEHTPIGGKLAFQKWRDRQGKAWMKIEYVYQTGEQLRHGTPLDDAHPPQRVILKLQGCPADANGFCAYDDFLNVMETALR